MWSEELRYPGQDEGPQGEEGPEIAPTEDIVRASSRAQDRAIWVILPFSWTAMMAS